MKVLRLIDVIEIRNLSIYLFKLRKWCRHRFSLSIIQKINVKVKFEKQSIKIFKSSQNKLYFLDTKILTNIILLSADELFFYIDMTKIVDNSCEYWHSNCWEFLIRICFDDYVKYFDDFSVFSSDFVRYLCDVNDCYNTHIHYEQIIFFDRDLKSKSSTKIKIICRIRSMICEIAVEHYSISFLYDWSQNKLLLIKNERTSTWHNNGEIR